MSRGSDVSIRGGCRVNLNHRWLLLIKDRVIIFTAVLVGDMNSEVIALHAVVVESVWSQNYL